MLATSLGLMALVYAGGVVRLWRVAGVGRGISRGQAAAFAAGLVTLAVALISPLHELSETRLSAHMVQHELLIIVAAPLIGLSSPLVAALWCFRRRRSIGGGLFTAGWIRWLQWTTAAPTVWLLHFVALWIWHLPSLYQAALASEPIHALEHLCFFGTACLFWWGMARGRYGRLGYGAAVIYIFATALQSGVLGALLTLSPSVWYPVYAVNAGTGGSALSALDDQQLAGLVMWIPSGVVFLMVGLGFLAAWIRESSRRARALSAMMLAILVLLSSPACDRMDSDKYARLVEDSASWAAAAIYAHQLRDEHQIPAAYWKDLIDSGSQATQQLQTPLRGSTSVQPELKDRAAALNDKVQQQFATCVQTGQFDAGVMQRLDTELRALAEKIRTPR